MMEAHRASAVDKVGWHNHTASIIRQVGEIGSTTLDGENRRLANVCWSNGRLHYDTIGVTDMEDHVTEHKANEYANHE